MANKIAQNLTTLGATRFDLKYGMGGFSHEALMTSIDLYARLLGLFAALATPLPAATRWL